MRPKRWPPLWLRVPAGTRDVLPEEAESLRRLERRLLGLFGRWGYREVRTPVLEFLSTVERGVGVEGPDALFVLVDRTGELLALRPEMTVPIARLVATHGKDRARLSYVAEVFRVRDTSRGEEREFVQAGVERIGDRGPDADAEVVALAVWALREAGVEGFRIGLGHAGLLRGLLEAAGLDAEDQHAAKLLLYRRDFVTLQGLLEGAPVTIREAILHLPSWRGPDALDRAARLGIAPGALEEVEHLLEALRPYGVGGEVEVDLGLIRDFEYYTGIVFEGYAQGVGRPVLGGGRYDGLLMRFGTDRPAVGFALHLNRLLPTLPPSAPSTVLSVVYVPRFRDLAVRLALALREEGIPVLTDPWPQPEVHAPCIMLEDEQARVCSRQGRERVVIPELHLLVQEAIEAWRS
ncbi:MAG: ATP phosphoribosyltransferase regulatory subunit [Armatimonadota bacterium]|nr:ATP phosphoribosyltransferase regulatory subunit [Armatimonadota bacterium]MDR7440040.1 ATP phosphoribosyltransferase regulatory subunit [Armatimonadota bacterium]MDR7562489.1 ATP phosphoribosyltransferase regulatory subunit [Armatimonadota bacterium]MDR7566812.1 ATP phosphoribosyltransferase regulatory subunit [Armatimonadota bacterium]MDR7601373.1 ATP phosphoribosyltransferase regulatory subunit [Armatimonadota bacterium]